MSPISPTTEPIWRVTPEKIKEAVFRITAAAAPRKIVVFGSQSRGNAHHDSDLDLIVVMDDVKNRLQESVRLRRLLRGLIMPVDIVVISQQEFDRRRRVPGNIFHEADQEGKIVYESVM
jgi:predicted nucleotidyltransferase